MRYEPATPEAVAAAREEFGRVRWRDDPAEWRRQWARDYRRGIRRTNGKRSVLLRMLDKINRDPGEPLITDPELLEPNDDMDDLYPGSGAVGRAWDAWRSQLEAVS